MELTQWPSWSQAAGKSCTSLERLTLLVIPRARRSVKRASHTRPQSHQTVERSSPRCKQRHLFRLLTLQPSKRKEELRPNTLDVRRPVRDKALSGEPRHGRTSLCL